MACLLLQGINWYISNSWLCLLVIVARCCLLLLLSSTCCCNSSSRLVDWANLCAFTPAAQSTSRSPFEIHSESLPQSQSQSTSQLASPLDYIIGNRFEICLVLCAILYKFFNAHCCAYLTQDKPPSSSLVPLPFVA